jgi:hypothetical protein
MQDGSLAVKPNFRCSDGSSLVITPPPPFWAPKHTALMPNKLLSFFVLFALHCISFFFFLLYGCLSLVLSLSHSFPSAVR